MATITVNKLSTSNTTPTITGTVDFERFDLKGNPKETIQVTVNYRVYKLFDGNLGLDESKKPNIWKLHFDTPLYRNTTYSIDAQVIDVETNRVIAEDPTNNELIITPLTPVQSAREPDNLNIIQKMAIVGGLMGAMNSLFSSSGFGRSSSVHPVKDDDSSTTLAGRGAEERNEDPRVKDKKARQAPNKIPLPPKRHQLAATAGDGGEPGFSGKSGDILQDALNGNVPDQDEANKLLAEAQAQQDAAARIAIDDKDAAAADAERAKLQEDINREQAAASGQTTSLVDYNQQQAAAGQPRSAFTLRNAGIINFGRSN